MHQIELCDNLGNCLKGTKIKVIINSHNKSSVEHKTLGALHGI